MKACSRCVVRSKVRGSQQRLGSVFPPLHAFFQTRIPCGIKLLCICNIWLPKKKKKRTMWLAIESCVCSSHNSTVSPGWEISHFAHPMNFLHPSSPLITVLCYHWACFPPFNCPWNSCVHLSDVCIPQSPKINSGCGQWLNSILEDRFLLRVGSQWVHTYLCSTYPTLRFGRTHLSFRNWIKCHKLDQMLLLLVLVSNPISSKKMYSK